MVSVNEMKEADEIPQDILGAIFEKQMELAKKYVDIENMGDLLESTETNVHTMEGQVWLKDFLYRTTEEVGESFEVILINEFAKKDWSMICDLDQTHYSEELIDSIHFFVELCIIAGIDRSEFLDISTYGKTSGNMDLTPTGFKVRHWEIIQNLTLAGNKLRNKKWKKTHVLTDVPIFTQYLIQAFDSIVACLRAVGLDDCDIYNLYFKKNKVNQFRQRSDY